MKGVGGSCTRHNETNDKNENISEVDAVHLIKKYRKESK